MKFSVRVSLMHATVLTCCRFLKSTRIRDRFVLLRGLPACVAVAALAQVSPDRKVKCDE